MSPLYIILTFVGCVVTLIAGPPIHGSGLNEQVAPRSWTHGLPHLTHDPAVPAITPTKPGYPTHHDYPVHPTHVYNDKRAEELRPLHHPSNSFKILPGTKDDQTSHPLADQFLGQAVPASLTDGELIQVFTTVNCQDIHLSGAGVSYHLVSYMTGPNAWVATSPASTVGRGHLTDEPFTLTTPPNSSKSTPSCIDGEKSKQTINSVMITRPSYPGEKASTYSHELHNHSSPSALSQPTSALNSVSHILITRPIPVRSEEQGSVIRPTLVSNSQAVSKCTTTLFKPAPFMLGPTSTVYASTSTHISFVQCHGCALVVEHGGPGPVVHYTTTVTVTAVKTADVVACTRGRLPILEGP